MTGIGSKQLRKSTQRTIATLLSKQAVPVKRWLDIQKTHLFQREPSALTQLDRCQSLQPIKTMPVP